MPQSSRDEFSSETKRIVANRVNLLCSNPQCCVFTSGPQDDVSKALNIGVAAHIAAASPEGPRYDKSQSSTERASAENAIWLCQNCAKLVDNDPRRFSVEILREWKECAEHQVLASIGKSARPSPTSISDKWVTLAYADKSGITSQLKEQGYKIRWSSAKREAERVDLEEWERVHFREADGTYSYLKVRDATAGGYLILLRKRM